ncbi:MAG: hypothetical protein H6907_07535 [Hyphomicrobiales bacterium]|nr:hypothetical protein [Hyphomicrobiales bacterium]MCP5371569.1 hypothetical protein [Hyphomicrobiales bacterium]
MTRPGERRYVGIHNDLYGGMTDTGKIIRDAWVFGLIPETETCEGWMVQGIQDLWDKVNAKWGEYGFRVANLPPEARERFDRIQAAAVARARAAGWDPERDVAEDEKEEVGPGEPV